jgi:hypothetical protein
MELTRYSSGGKEAKTLKKLELMEVAPSGKEMTPWSPNVVGQVREEANVPFKLRGCRDCVYHVVDECHHPSFGTNYLDSFRGKIVRRDRPKWKNMREPNGPCGIDAKLWTKTPPHKGHRLYGWLTLGLTGLMAYLIFGVGTLWSLALIPVILLTLLIYAAIGSE